MLSIPEARSDWANVLALDSEGQRFWTTGQGLAAVRPGRTFA